MNEDIIKILVDALKFYAPEDAWEDDVTIKSEDDWTIDDYSPEYGPIRKGGRRAREALKALRESNE